MLQKVDFGLFTYVILAGFLFHVILRIGMTQDLQQFAGLVNMFI